MNGREGDNFNIKLTPEGVKWTSRYFIVNNANIDVPVTNVYCSNEEIEWKRTTQRPCDINLVDKKIPFVLKAGSIEQVDATILIEPKGKAFSVLVDTIKKRPNASAMEYSEALTEAEIDIDGNKIAVDKDRSPGHVFPVGGLGTGQDSDLSTYDLLTKHIEQGEVLFIETGRNNRFISPHFKLFMPAIGF